MSTKPLSSASENKTLQPLALRKINFMLMAASAAIIILGFLLMLGSGSAHDGNAFNPEIFSTRRIVVGPTIAFLGFIMMGVAIMWNGTKKFKTKQNKEEKINDLD